MSIAAIVGFQAAAGLIATALVALFAGGAAAVSSLLGVLICLVPAALFAGFVITGMFLSQTPRIQLHGFYAGEVFKLAITVVLFTLVFTTADGLQPLFLFTGFMATQLAMIGVLLRG